MSDSPTVFEGNSASNRQTRGETSAAATRREVPGGGIGAPTRRQGSGRAVRGRRLNLPEPVASRYDYLRDLPASGGEADIALLQDRASGEQVIFKSYRVGLGPDPLAMDTLRDADADHVVRLVEYRDDHDGTWEIQEFCPLGSLREWVAARGGRLPKDLLGTVLRETAAALKYLHDLGSGIAHRDLKPANVLVRSDDPLDLVLTDFGLAKAHQSITHVTKVVKGTWHYAAPEVHSGQSSAKSDWFSLGAMIYEFYTGRKLFALADGTEISDDDAKARSVARNYSTDLIDDPRWRLLADGLLTWDKDQRWGAAQVDAWLRGESPPVIDTANAAPTAPGRTLGYRPAWSPTLVMTLQELAEQLRRHWDSASSELAGRPDQRMTRFLEGFPGMEDAVRIINSTDSPGPKLVRLQGLLDPQGPIHYGEAALDDQSLRERIRLADAGDQSALDWLQAVLDEHILTAYAEVTGSQEAAQADYLLAKWKSQADEVTKTLPHGDYQTLARQEFRKSLPSLFATALGGGTSRRRAAASADPADDKRSPAPRSGLRGLLARVADRLAGEPGRRPTQNAGRSSGTGTHGDTVSTGSLANNRQTATSLQRPSASAGQPAAQTTTMTIPRNRIGAVIGSGGLVVTRIQNDTGTHIKVDDDGTIRITAMNPADAERARQAVNAIANPPAVRVGDRHLGTITRTTSYGAFVRLPSGREGLLHISKLRTLNAGRRVERVEDILTVGQQLQVEVVEVQSGGKLALAPATGSTS